MNYVEIPINLLLDIAHNCTDKVVLMYLIWRQGKNQNCWPAIRTISRELGISRDTVQKSLERLSKAGSVSISTPEKRGRNHKNSYVVNGLNFRTIKGVNGLKTRPIQDKEWPENQDTNGLKTRTELTTVTNTIEEEEKKTDTAFVEFWNSQKNLPEIKAFTSQRKVHFQARMREPLFAENWREIIGKLSGSSFCTGKNDRGWLADVDWVLKNGTNYTKVFEGKYDGKQGDAGKTPEQDGYEGYHGDVIGNDGNVITHAFSDEEIENLRVQGVHI
jgi:predicted transcriptional regulator